ncbi:hypothetical protein [Comamonas sp. CMM02]|uniref:hypothetical protein n=1 Tax=Comamonas sp. CMM02 TaxID=2769307 RepID=UPI001780356A|nr:hypothetical protein [Comamonas sp. CMM02]MBD9400826.1 hypothetical protein [Comamonas sp. CMM02]
MSNIELMFAIRRFLSQWGIFLNSSKTELKIPEKDNLTKKFNIEIRNIISFNDDLISRNKEYLPDLPISLIRKSEKLVVESTKRVENYKDFTDNTLLQEIVDRQMELSLILVPFLSKAPSFKEGENIAKDREEVKIEIDKLKLAANEFKLQLNKENDKLNNKLIDADDKINKIKSFNEYLFPSEEDKQSIEFRIRSTLDRINIEEQAISDFYKSLLVGPDSKALIIGQYARDSQKINSELNDLRDRYLEQSREIENYSQLVLGTDDGGEKKDGLKHLIEKSIIDLNNYEKDSKRRRDTIVNQIESLLPGATSVGLAIAYKKLKDSFDSKIQNYTKVFYLALTVLFVSALIMVVDFSFKPWSFKIDKSNNWDEMLRMLLVRIPILIPIIWIAVFSATRRSQYERLQQEYAHKEALASSYEGYKKQLQDLKVDSNDLQKELIAKSIDALSYNASKSLDGKYIEKTPFSHLIENIDLNKFFESFGKINK